MKQAAALFLLCCLLLPSFAHAAEADRAKTMELFRVMNLDTVFDKQMELLMPALMQIVKGGHSKLPDRATDIVSEEVQNMFRDLKPKIMDGFAELYENHFTPEEIVALVAVFKTPVLQKLTRLQTSLMQEGAVMVNSIMQAELDQYLDRIEARIDKEFPEGFSKEQ